MFGLKIVKRDWLDRLMQKQVALARENDALVERLDELQTANRKPQTESRFDPLTRDELLTAFAVGDDDPLLMAIIHVVHAMEIERGDNAGSSALPPEQAKGYAMAAAALKDAQEEILGWVDQANKAKRNAQDE